MPFSSKTPGMTGQRPGMMRQQPKLLKTLRVKFIMMNMLLAALVLVGAFGTVCYLDYSQRLNTLYEELHVVLSDAARPDSPQIEGIRKLTRDATGDIVIEATAPQSTNTETKARTGVLTSLDEIPNINYAVPTIGSAVGLNTSAVLVAVYSVAPNGIYTVVGDYTNAAIPESVILRANDIAMESDSSRGYISEYNLYFERMKSAKNPRETVVAYADGSSVSGWTNLAIILVLVGCAGLVALFLMNIFFSRWAMRPVERSIRQQQQFTADASHELKTPLTVILANMEILRSQPEASVDSQMQWVDSTHTEAARMQLLVNDMLELSKPDSQRVEYATEQVDFSDLVEGEVLQFESVAFERGVELDASIDEGLIVEGNPERLARMVATLVDNACKYAGLRDEEAGGADVAEDDGDEVCREAAPGEVEDLADEVSLLEDELAAEAEDVEAAEAGDESEGEVSADSVSEDAPANDEDIDKVSNEKSAVDESADDDAAAAAENDVIKDAVADGTLILDSDDIVDGLILDDDDYDEDDAEEKLPCVSVALVRREVSGMRADEAILVVHNDGPCIPEEDIPYIFNRFYRADKARTSSKGGYGLGLAIGQEIAQQHNGNITVASTASEGTTFTVILPLID